MKGCVSKQKTTWSCLHIIKSLRRKCPKVPQGKSMPSSIPYHELGEVNPNCSKCGNSLNTTKERGPRPREGKHTSTHRNAIVVDLHSRGLIADCAFTNSAGQGRRGKSEKGGRGKLLCEHLSYSSPLYYGMATLCAPSFQRDRVCMSTVLYRRPL